MYRDSKDIANSNNLERSFIADNDEGIDISIDILEDTQIIGTRGELLSVEEVEIDNFIEFKMSDFWKESLVENCHIKKDVIIEMKSFVNDSLSEKEIKENGGFLLGRFIKNENKTYTVFVEKFIKPTIEHRDLYQINFGVKALLELDNELETNKEFGLIGWFHTHPGHTPYLSPQDLTIQVGSFKEPWQTAMVSDPLTDEFDSMIFSWQKDYCINNYNPLAKNKYFGLINKK